MSAGRRVRHSLSGSGIVATPKEGRRNVRLRSLRKRGSSTSLPQGLSTSRRRPRARGPDGSDDRAALTQRAKRRAGSRGVPLGRRKPLLRRVGTWNEGTCSCENQEAPDSGPRGQLHRAVLAGKNRPPGFELPARKLGRDCAGLAGASPSDNESRPPRKPGTGGEWIEAAFES